MLEKIREISLRKAGWVTAVIGVIGIVLHSLVLTGILPYQWVNGGRTESLEMAKQVACSSIAIIVITKVIGLIGAGIIPVKMNRSFQIVLSILLIGIAAFSFVGFIQQLLGTMLEKCVMSILTIINFVADLRIAVEKRGE